MASIFTGRCGLRRDVFSVSLEDMPVRARATGQEEGRPGMDSDMQADHRPSRRALVRGAAGAATLGAVAIASAGTAQAKAAPEAAPGATGALASEADRVGHAVSEEPIVVHLRDARTGHLDLYVGERHVHVLDRDLASRLAAAAR
jgi:hypothetical protein